MQRQYINTHTESILARRAYFLMPISFVFSRLISVAFSSFAFVADSALRSEHTESSTLKRKLRKSVSHSDSFRGIPVVLFDKFVEHFRTLFQVVLCCHQLLLLCLCGRERCREGFCGVAVITCASHAQGPRFDPGRKHTFKLFIEFVLYATVQCVCGCFY